MFIYQQSCVKQTDVDLIFVITNTQELIVSHHILDFYLFFPLLVAQVEHSQYGGSKETDPYNSVKLQ